MIPAPARKIISQRLSTGVIPEPLPESPLEFASRLTFRQGKKTEGYQPEKHPPQWFYLYMFGKALDGKVPYRRFISQKPTQDGGTLVSQSIPQLYFTGVLGDPFVAGFPDMVLAGKQWRNKTRPLIEDSKLTSWFPVTGMGSEGSSTPSEINLNGTPLYFLGAGASNESGQAMITCRGLGRDEYDGIDPHNAVLMEGRLDSYGHDGFIFDNSTLKHDHDTPFTKALRESTDYHLEYACIHCRRFVHWKWDKHIKIDLDSVTAARDSVCLVCPHCTGTMNDLERIQMDFFSLDNVRFVARGQHVDETGAVIGELPDTLSFGLTWTALDSPRTSLSYLAVKYYEANEELKNGDHYLMRRFFRDRLCLPYTGDRDAIEQHHVIRCVGLAARSAASKYELSTHETIPGGDSRHWCSTAPDGVAYLTAGVDVNPGGERAPGRLYWLLIGSTPDGQIFDLGWGSVAISSEGTEATEHELHDGLTRLRLQLIEIAEELGLPLANVGCDVGDRQDEIRRWLVRHPDWTAVKDHIGKSLALETRYTHLGLAMDKPVHRRDLAGWVHWRFQKEGWWLATIDTNEARHQAQTGFLVAPGKPGAYHLPKGVLAKDALIAHYCATGRIPNGKSGTRWADKKADREHWPDFQTRRDYLACRTYAVTLDYAHRRRLTAKPHKLKRRSGLVKKI